MYFIIRKGGNSRRSTVTVDLSGWSVVFHRVWINGERVMVGKIAKNHPHARAVIAQARRLPHYTVTDIAPYTAGDLPVVSRVSPAASSPPPVVTQQEIPVSAALRNGWRPTDLLGAGEGVGPARWGELGGRSPRSGLTMGEMAICQPPEGWAEKSAAYWPWQFVGWRGPGLDWKPPRMGHKEGYIEIIKTSDESGEEVVDDEAGEAVEGEALNDSDSDDDDVDDEESEALDALQATLITYSDDRGTLERAIQVLRGLVNTTNELPSRQKANHIFTRKQTPPLPSVNEVQLRALLQAAQLL